MEIQPLSDNPTGVTITINQLPRRTDMENKTARKMTNAEYHRAKLRAVSGSWEKSRFSFSESITGTVAKRLTDHILKHMPKR